MGTFLFMASAARLLSPDEFGQYAFGLATVAAIVSVIRAICGETFIVRMEPGARSDRGTRDMLGAALLISLGVSVAFLAISLFLPSKSGLLQATAIAVPGAVLQDANRHGLIANRRTTSLLAFDAFFVSAALVAIQLSARYFGQGALVLLAWGLVGAVVSVLLYVGTGWWPLRVSPVKWLRSVWGYSSAYAMEALTGAAIGYSTIMMISIFASDAEVGAFRATVSIFGVTSIASNFLKSTVLREMTLRGRSSPVAVARDQRQMAIFQMGVVVGTGLLLVLLPGSIGEMLFGATWSMVNALIPAGAVNRLAAALSVVPSVALRGLQISWRATKLRIIVSAIGLGFGPLGAYFAGASGALLAESLSYLLLASVLQVQVRRVLSERMEEDRA